MDEETVLKTVAGKIRQEFDSLTFRFMEASPNGMAAVC